MKEIRIIGLLITDRIKEAGRTQNTLSKYGQIIKSRLGFHEVSREVCSRVGVIILQLSGSVDTMNQLEHDLHEIEGLEVQRMSFTV
jgi:hypothetical protein